MPSPIATAYVEIRPDTSKFTTDINGRLRDERGRFVGAGKQVGDDIGDGIQQGLGPSLRGIGQAIASFAIGQQLIASMREFEEAEDIANQTAAAIESTGAAANVTADDVDTLAGRLSNLAAVDDDLIQQGANLLLTFTRVRNEVGEGNDVFDQGVEAALNMSAAMGTDLNGAVLQVGKALNDPIRGITALQRAGVQLTDQQKESIRTFVAQGDVLSAQKIILEELETQFGGSAAAQASALDRITVATGNLKESIGGVLAPILEAAVPLVERLVSTFEDLPGPIQTAIVAAVGIGVAARPINEIVTLTRTLRGSTEGAATGMSRLGRAGAALAAVGIAATIAEIHRETNGLTVSLEEAAEATIDQLVQSFETLGGTRGDVAIDFFRQLAEGGEATFESASQLRDELARTGQDVSELDEILQAAGESHGRAADRTREGTAALSEYEGTAEGAAGATSELAGAQGELETVYRTSAEAIAEYEEGVQNITEGMHDYATELFGVLDPQIQWNASLDEATTLLAEHGLTLDVDTEAGRNNLETGRELHDNLTDLIEAHYRETGSLSAAIGAGNLYVEQLRTTLLEAGYTEEEVQNYITTLGLVPGDIATNFTANTREAVEEIQALQRLALGVAAGSYEVNMSARTGPGGGGARAHGGPTYMGVAYDVGLGEKFIPAVDGRILSRDDSMRALGGQGGRSVQPVSVTVNNYGSGDRTGSTVRRELERAQMLATAGGW